MLTRITALLLVLTLLAGCKNTAPAYTIEDITGRFAAAGITVLQQDPAFQDPTYGAALHTFLLQVGDVKAPVMIWLFPSPDQVPLDKMGPDLVSTANAKAWENLYQAHTAGVFILSDSGAAMAAIKKALPVTKAYQYKGQK